MRIGLAAMAALCLTACLSIPVTSLPKLAALSPETMDLTALEVGVRTPDVFRLVDDATKLTFTVSRDGDSKPRVESFVLQMAPGDSEAGLESFRKKGERLYRLRINPADHERIKTFRADALAMKALPGKKSLSVSAGTGLCLVQGAKFGQTPQFALFLKPAPSDDYFMFIKPTKVPVTDDAGKLKRCGA